MSKRTAVLLSALILFVAFSLMVNMSAMTASADETTDGGGGGGGGIAPTTTVTTTTTSTTVTAPTQNTRTSWTMTTPSFPLTIPSTWPWEKDKTTTTVPSSEPEPSGQVSESETDNSNETYTDSSGNVITRTTKKITTTTKKPTTTVRKMTIVVAPNTTVAGTAVDPLSAYYSRMSGTDENGEILSTGEALTGGGTVGEDDGEPLNPAVTVIIAVAAMLIATCGLTGFFSMRNKRLAEKGNSDGDYSRETGDVIVAKKRTEPNFVHTVVDEDDIGDELLTDTAAQTDNALPRASTVDARRDNAGKTVDIENADNETAEPPQTDEKIQGNQIPTEFDDIFSGRDDLE